MRTAGLGPAALNAQAFKSLFGRRARGLENRGPAGHLALDELLQGFRGPLGCAWDHAAKLQEALLGILVLERLDKRVAQLLDHLRGGALRREGRVPSADLITLKAGFLG